ncbi:hypothetical protein JTB14_001621 [Gonioctena quinquepunctata]|nr:hypothetical protein JTB14_001621 [Gonioctena quinquepunctata]
MAYSLYEKPLKSAKEVQYFPEEYDYPDYYNIARATYSNDSPYLPSRKCKNLPSVDYENERKCPIYIHQFNKPPNSSMYNNYSKNGDNDATGKRNTQLKKNKSKNSKLMLDKLEETYWATWKPSKEAKNPKYANTAKRSYERDVKSESKRQEVSDHLIKYFEFSDFPSSSGSVLGGKSTNRFEASTHTQEIQTDFVIPEVVIPELPEKNSDEIDDFETELPPDEVSSHETLVLVKSEEHQETVTLKTDEGSIETLIEENKTDIANTLVEGNGGSNKIKTLLNHTDSVIIHRKKQDGVKNEVQQPKCIKLYKKVGSGVSKGGSYPLKGGTYPLKSCLKKTSTEKSNFRLGAPGSPLFVTSNSFNKKYCR